MNSARATLSRLGVGVFSVVLGAVLLLMIVGLYLADQALLQGSRSQARVDARESALVIERTLDGERDALAALRGAMALPEARPETVLPVLARGVARERRGVTWLWVTDSTGRLLFDTTVAATTTTGDAGATGGAIRDARGVIASRRPAIRPVGMRAATREILVVVPLVLDGRTVGVAGAFFDARALFAPLVEAGGSDRARLVVRARQDTILVTSGRAGATESGTATAAVPFGEPWTVETAYLRGTSPMRSTVWVLGIVGIVALFSGVIRERRQAARVAQRSAELERLSAELLRANRMKSEFLANVSHELRTPLNAIVGFVELLRDGVYGELGPRQAGPVERIAASATHLRHLVDQVLDIAKIAAGRLEVHPELVVLRPFVLNVAGELESLVSERGLTLSLAIGASLPRVRTDPQHLRQILVNLIGNAVKYTETGGIAVRARLVGAPKRADRADRLAAPDDPMLLARAPDAARTWIAVQVIDTGIGIAPADQERIFEEFEQVNAGSRTDSMERGTGLGLAISRRLARLLGGDITVDSQEGKGSTFTLWLPVNAADLEAATKPRAATPAAATATVEGG